MVKFTVLPQQEGYQPVNFPLFIFLLSTITILCPFWKSLHHFCDKAVFILVLVEIESLSAIILLPHIIPTLSPHHPANRLDELEQINTSYNAMNLP